MDSQPQYQPHNHSFSVVYHHLFSYPLNKSELKKWETSSKNFKLNNKIQLQIYRNYFFVKGYKHFVAKKIKRKEISKMKRNIAEESARLIGIVPTNELIGITGSLAMDNCKVNSDIDLIVVCSPNTLWSSRMVTLLLLKLKGIKTRKAGVKTQRDLICLNMWMESSDMHIESKNLYTAHELLQIIPLVDKGNVFKKLIRINSWSSKYWHNAYKQALKIKFKISQKKPNSFVVLCFKLFNPLAFVIQYMYMKPKITREQVGYHNAFFHPKDGSVWVERQLAKYGVIPINP